MLLAELFSTGAHTLSYSWGACEGRLGCTAFSEQINAWHIVAQLISRLYGAEDVG